MSPVLSDVSTQEVAGWAANINDAGQVAFIALDVETLTTHLWRWEDGVLEEIANDGLFPGLTGTPGLGADGRVSFVSEGATRNGVYVGYGSEREFEDYAVVFEDVTSSPLPTILGGTEIGASRWVAFYRLEDGSSSRRRFLHRGDGEELVLVAEEGSTTSDQDGPLREPYGLAMDDAGRVAFHTARQDEPGAGIFVFDGVEIRTLVEWGPDSTTRPGGLLALNGRGELAYEEEAHGNPGDFTVYAAGEAVLRDGDTIDGEAVTDVVFLPNAFNDAHQLALHLRFASGAYAVYRADPIPPVPALAPVPAAAAALLVVATAASALRRKIPGADRAYSR